MKIRPVVLAGGRGTRLRPRTEVMPKPLLPVDGRPLLWYAIRAAHEAAGRPVVVLDYKADLIEAFFGEEDLDMIELPGSRMVQSLLTVSEREPADAYLCMSCDVLLPSAALSDTVALAREGECSALSFTELPEAGHKHWHYEISDGVLTGLDKKESKTAHERVALVVRHEDLQNALAPLPKPIRSETNPANLQPFNDGWTMLLRALMDQGVEVRGMQSDLPVCNVNVPEDFAAASEFVRKRP